MGRFEEAGLVLRLRWKCEVPALRLKVLCRRGLGAVEAGEGGQRGYGWVWLQLKP